MSETICGFQIVKSSDSFFKMSPYNNIKKFEGKRYEGISRMHLFDILEDYYNKSLPREINTIVENSLKENNDLSIEIIRNFDDALRVIEYTKARSSDNEIISLKSEVLQKIKGSFVFNEKEIEWLGYDVISYGNGSLILDGVLFKNQYFTKWLSDLNHNGLFDSTENIDDFIAYYQDCSKRNIVEEFPFSNYGFDAIAVGKVKL
jgi:hypothetical protein